MKKEEIIKLKINEFIELEQNINDIKLLKSFNTKKLSKRKMWKLLQPIHSDTQPEVFGQFKSRNFLSVKLYHKCPNVFKFY